MMNVLLIIGLIILTIAFSFVAIAEFLAKKYTIDHRFDNLKFLIEQVNKEKLMNDSKIPEGNNE